MKKLVICLAAIIFLGAAAPSKAADVTVGATTWYTWCDMEGSSADPAFLYGPVLGIKFNDDFGLNFVFLYGKIDTQQTAMNVTYTRYDSDLSMSYKLSSYLKLFAGVKFMGYTNPVMGYDFNHLALGPGAGLSGVFPVADNFFLLANASGMYLRGKNSTDLPSYVENKYNEYGYNSSASIAYYIAPASVTLSLGGRYQYFKTDYDSSSTSPSNTDTKFYGITASATYTF